MKKIAVFLLIALVLSVVGCANNNASDTLSSENEALKKEIEALKNITAETSEIIPEVQTTIEASTPEPTEPPTTTEKPTEPPTTTEKTTDPPTTAKPQESKIWEMKYYVDNFKEPTDQGYIYNPDLFYGIFSNSSTTNDDLTVKVLVDKESMSFVLYEYERYQVKNSYSDSRMYNIIMKTQDNTKYTLYGVMFSDGGDRIYVCTKEDWYKDPQEFEKGKDFVIDALNKNDFADFYIEQEDRKSTSYLFSMQSANFADEYSKLK